MTKYIGSVDDPQSRQYRKQLEQLESLRSEDTPRRLMITHTIESCWIPSQNKVEWPWRYRSRSKDHLYQIWKESIRNCRSHRADMIFKPKAIWPWRCRSRSKVIICNTFSHISDHLCSIWKESIKNCRFFFKVKAEKFQTSAKNSIFQIL